MGKDILVQEGLFKGLCGIVRVALRVEGFGMSMPPIEKGEEFKIDEDNEYLAHSLDRRLRIKVPVNGIMWDENHTNINGGNVHTLMAKGDTIVSYCGKVLSVYSDERSGVIGWKELLGQLKMPEALYKKLIATGDASVVGALKALNLLKMEHDKGLHYTVLGSVKTDLSLKRGIFSYLLQTKSFLWARYLGNNRSSHLWKENVHGVVVQKMVEHMKTIGGVDSALDCMNGLMDLLDDVEEDVELSDEVVMSLKATGKWEEETYLDSRGKESYRYTSPTGEIIEKPAFGCTDYASAQGKYNAAMAAYTKQQERENV